MVLGFPTIEQGFPQNFRQPFDTLRNTVGVPHLAQFGV